MSPPPPRKSHGFTLVELAIVLVIIGLLVGGVLVAQDLIYAAKWRGFWREKEEIALSINTFRLKYGSLPGDFPVATTYFPLANNGDGNGMYNYTGPAWIIEQMEIWRQLSFANMTKINCANGTNNTCTYTTTTPFTAGVNYPKSNVLDFPNGAWTMGWHASGTAPNLLVYGFYSAGWVPAGGLISVDDVRGLEQKYDDGQPWTGFLRSYGNLTGPPWCTVGPGQGNVYNNAGSGAVCTVSFKIL